MTVETITRTAPGWQEWTLTLLPVEERVGDGAGAVVALPGGFARLALLVDVLSPGEGGLCLRVQQSADGEGWRDLAALPVEEAGPQVVWVEAEDVEHVPDCVLVRAGWEASAEFRHRFGLEVVAIYACEEPAGGGAG